MRLLGGFSSELYVTSPGGVGEMCIPLTLNDLGHDPLSVLSPTLIIYKMGTRVPFPKASECVSSVLGS